MDLLVFAQKLRIQ
jgi:hypothetical protein